MSGHPYWRHEISTRLQDLQRELGQVLAGYRPPPAGPSGDRADLPTDLDPSAWTPAYDLLESPEDVFVWVDLPGVDPATIDLTISGTVMNLRGQRAALDEALTARTHVLERPVGPFHRQVPLPCEVDVEKVDARARDGVLVVRLPKAEAIRPRTIPIRPS